MNSSQALLFAVQEPYGTHNQRYAVYNVIQFQGFWGFPGFWCDVYGLLIRSQPDIDISCVITAWSRHEAIGASWSMPHSAISELWCWRGGENLELEKPVEKAGNFGFDARANGNLSGLPLDKTTQPKQIHNHMPNCFCSGALYAGGSLYCDEFNGEQDGPSGHRWDKHTHVERWTC